MNGVDDKKLKTFEIAVSLLLTISLGLSAWMLHTVVRHGEELSSHTAIIQAITERLAKIESGGSGKLQAHESMDDQRAKEDSERIAKNERDLAALAVILGSIQEKLGSLSTKMDFIIEDHRKEKKL